MNCVLYAPIVFLALPIVNMLHRVLSHGSVYPKYLHLLAFQGPPASHPTLLKEMYTG